MHQFARKRIAAVRLRFVVLLGFERAFESPAQAFFGHGFLNAVAAVDGDNGNVVVEFFADGQVFVDVDALDPEIEIAVQKVEQMRGIVAQMATRSPVKAHMKRLAQVEHVGGAAVGTGNRRW